MERRAKSMRNALYGITLAIQFLTRIPLPIHCPLNKQTWRWALRCFPIVGFIIGGCLVGIYSLFYQMLPSYILIPLLLTGWIFLTGGLHLDGWMDLADAIGSNGSMEKKREIMKDSRVGSFAILAILFMLVWKGIFLYTILDGYGRNIYMITLIFLFIPMVARFQGLLILSFFKPYQNEGLAFTFKEHLRKKDMILSLLILIPFFFLQQKFIILLVLQAFVSFLFGKWTVKHLGGINGDVVGASIEGAELWNLGILSIYILFVMG